MALTREEREQFLAEPHIAALAVDAGDGRAPLTVPVWHQYAPGGDVRIMTGNKLNCICCNSSQRPPRTFWPIRGAASRLS